MTSSGDGRIKCQYKDMSSTATSAEGTVGIENHTETDGIQYFFDGDWDIHAHHIENEFAVLYTTPAEGPQLAIELTYVSGSPVPSGGGNLNFGVYIENVGTTTANFDAWLDISYEGGPPTTVVQRYLTGFGPGWIINRPDAWFPIPASYAAGNYTMTGKVGDHPDNVWASSGFPFSKSGVYNGGTFTPFVPDVYFPDPFLIAGSEEDFALVKPEQFELSQNYPNPFNPLTTIAFSLPEAAHVKLTVFNVRGQEISTLVDEMRTAAVHEVVWDASDLASGLYFYRIEAGNYSAVRKMMLIK
jgi:hypothetical protein